MNEEELTQRSLLLSLQLLLGLILCRRTFFSSSCLFSCVRLRAQKSSVNREVKLGYCSWTGCLAAELFATAASVDTVSVALFPTAVERASCQVLTSLDCCMSTLRLVHYALLLTPACWKSNNTNARLMAFIPSLALDPTSGIHSHKTLDTAQPCHLLKPN